MEGQPLSLICIDSSASTCDPLVRKETQKEKGDEEREETEADDNTAV